ncbi:MAG TPA: hypothetical protein PKA27_15500, partial [Fimbriimonadaceae bacterium]|nr:hypothetical protein [Fimbriimonadaceae bacterium]
FIAHSSGRASASLDDYRMAFTNKGFDGVCDKGDAAFTAFGFSYDSNVHVVCARVRTVLGDG